MSSDQLYDVWQALDAAARAAEAEAFDAEIEAIAALRLEHSKRMSAQKARRLADKAYGLWFRAVKEKVK